MHLGGGQKRGRHGWQSKWCVEQNSTQLLPVLKSLCQTALLPEAQSLINLSSYLIPTRPALASPVPFPGAPRPTDLNALSQSTPPPESTLTKDDLVDLSELYHDLIRICERAEKRGVKIILDAEYRFVVCTSKCQAADLRVPLPQLVSGKNWLNRVIFNHTC